MKCHKGRFAKVFYIAEICKRRRRVLETVQAVALLTHIKGIYSCPLRVLPEGLSNHSPLRPPSDGMGRRETHSRCILRRRSRRPLPQLARKVGRTVRNGPHVAYRDFVGNNAQKLPPRGWSVRVRSKIVLTTHSPRATLLR